MNVKALGQFCWFLVLRFEGNENRSKAAELTFVTLFAIVPLMASGYVMLTWFPQYSSLIDTFHDFIFQHFVPASGDAIQGYLSDFSQQAKKLTWIGLIILLFSALSLMMTIERSFNQIWRVKSIRVGRRVLFYWLVIVLGPVFLSVAFLLSSYLLSSQLWVDHVDSVFHFNELLFKWLPFLISMIALTGMYYFLPSSQVRLKHALAGGFFGAICLEICKIGFVKMVSFSPSYQLIYGAFAVVPLFLLWIFVAWCVVLLGAELVRAMPFIHKSSYGKQASELDWALIILQQLQSTHAQHRITREELCQALTLVNVDEWESVLVTLMEGDWLINQDDELYLNKDLAMTTVGELSELIHGERISKLAVVDTHTSWFETLNPLLLSLREQKKTALGLPIKKVI
ncbi:MAG: YihY family inner membrane protein [Bermanella sp.]